MCQLFKLLLILTQSIDLSFRILRIRKIGKQISLPDLLLTIPLFNLHSVYFHYAFSLWFVLWSFNIFLVLAAVAGGHSILLHFQRERQSLLPSFWCFHLLFLYL